jgi:hypothetical protein
MTKIVARLKRLGLEGRTAVSRDNEVTALVLLKLSEACDIGTTA